MDLMRVLKNVISNPPYPSSWATLYLAQNRWVSCSVHTNIFTSVAWRALLLRASIHRSERGLAAFANSSIL